MLTLYGYIRNVFYIE
ncbi:Disrupted colicin M immunity protein [Escherichia coli]|uniref:Disrupted colicin M immunity protein n=1 Tax=Escherichia coli TaxID=562 RepID=C3UUF8_ECOLX|nr:disrupted colicin M immunity protein [Escherichia coli]